MSRTPYDIDLDRNPANFQPLTPLTFLERAASVFPDRTAIVHGDLRRSYRDFYARTRRLASALVERGIKRGDTVAVMLANTPAMLECHYGVPMAGAVLNTLNTRLDAPIIAFSLDHGGGQGPDHRPGILEDRQAGPRAREGQADRHRLRRSGICPAPASASARSSTRRSWPMATPTTPGRCRRDEWDAIALNYTSGTTGDPKGVVYHHRGAYLLAIGNVVTCGMGKHPVYLWTLPMFHCNGWCFPWSISVVAGTHVCLRQVRAKAMYDALADRGVTHLCGAPIVMSTLLNAPAARETPAAAEGAVLHRRRAAAGGGARSDEGGGLRRHPPLRPDGGLRPRRHQRLASRVGRSAGRRIRGEEGPPGRALYRCSKASTCSIRRRWRRCPRTARPSAR